MTDNILVVDDEAEIADLLELYLKNENYTVFKYYSPKEALTCIESIELDLAVIDIMMPDMNGFALCQKIREHYNYPIIMLTAKIEEINKITGLTLGADDYVTKPFKPLELVARVKAQLRRYKKYSVAPVTNKSHNIITCSDLSLNMDTHECFVDERTVSLTPTEFKILETLCKRKGYVISPEQLFHEVWSDEHFDRNNNTITVHIRNLREKIGDSYDSPKYIKTIWGVGYKIES